MLQQLLLLVVLVHLSQESFQLRSVKNLRAILYFIQLKINQYLKTKLFQYLEEEIQLWIGLLNYQTTPK